MLWRTVTRRHKTKANQNSSSCIIVDYYNKCEWKLSRSAIEEIIPIWPLIPQSINTTHYVEIFQHCQNSKVFIHSQYKWKYNRKSKLKFHYFLKDQSTTYNFTKFLFILSLYWCHTDKWKTIRKVVPACYRNEEGKMEIISININN